MSPASRQGELEVGSGFPSVTVSGSACNLRLLIPGRPVSKARPRFRVQQSRSGKPFVQVYSDPETVKWEETAAWQVRSQLARLPRSSPGEVLLPWRDFRVIVDLRINYDRPRRGARKTPVPVASRDDVDNVAKIVLDMLQKAGVLANDSRVTDLSVRRRYSDLLGGHPEGVEIDLTAIPADLS